MTTPVATGWYMYTAHMPDAEPSPLEVVRYKGALFAVLPDDDEIEMYPLEDLSGTFAWAPDFESVVQEDAVNRAHVNFECGVVMQSRDRRAIAVD